MDTRIKLKALVIQISNTASVVFIHHMNVHFSVQKADVVGVRKGNGLVVGNIFFCLIPLVANRTGSNSVWVRRHSV